MTRSWLQQHFSSFVYPRLGVSKATLAIASEAFPAPYFTPAEMTAIKEVWRATLCAARGRRIILAGRDVWLFEVLARRSGSKTVFLPALSRNTVGHSSWRSLIKRDDFLFDTGFSGTIPQKLQLHNKAWRLLSANSRSQYILPNLLNNRDLALKIERTPKYWRSACLRNKYSDGYNKPAIQIIQQDLSDLGEFLNAAQLTQQLYLDSSPRCALRAGLLKHPKATQFKMPPKVSYAN